MSSSKVTAWLIATMMLLSMGFVLYPQGSANAATYISSREGQRLQDRLTAHIESKSVSRTRKGTRGRPLLQNEDVTSPSS
jgi:hypothetical protein